MASSAPAGLPDLIQPSTPAAESLALSWLLMVRWAGVAAALAAVAIGWGGLGAPTVLPGAAVVITFGAASNLWLAYRLRRKPEPRLAVGGWLVCADVLGLSWLLADSGGVLNPVSIFYLVDIVLAALVLGRAWTWIVALLSIAGYGVLFMAPSDEVRSARLMHPEIGMHIRGMWLAFAATATIVALLVTRLATLVERRDRALAAMRERHARHAHMIALATLAAGAAHELSTPLGTIAVAARELERSLDEPHGAAGHADDIRLIRAEIDRCRRVLNDMAGRTGEAIGEAPAARQLAALLQDAASLLTIEDRARVEVVVPSDLTVRWPPAAMSRAMANLLQNGLQASTDPDVVTVSAGMSPSGAVTVTIRDRGHGMPADVLRRAGEPFFTTKPDGAGMGLGLFVATSTIEQLGGTIRLSSSEERGTTVDVSLPPDVAP